MEEKYAKILPQVYFSFIDHPFQKPSYVIYFCGCPRSCKGCHNKELQNANNPKCVQVDYNQLFRKLFYYKDKFKEIDSLVLLGGEPTLYPYFLKMFLSRVKTVLHLEVVLYTGYLLEELLLKSYKFLLYVDIVVDGEYVEELATGKFPASSNQRVWKKEKSFWEDITFLFLS